MILNEAAIAIVTGDALPVPIDDGGEVVLVLRAVVDPQTRHGCPERRPSYRLKLLLKFALRGLGFKAVAVRDRMPGDPQPVADGRAMGRATGVEASL